MIEKATSAANIQSMLRTMSALQLEASSNTKTSQSNFIASSSIGIESNGATKVSSNSFSESVKHLVEQVNDAQSKASNLRESYEMGQDVPLTNVVIGMQKASLAFEATLQVRNKVMKAYEDILNMPV